MKDSLTISLMIGRTDDRQNFCSQAEMGPRLQHLLLDLFMIVLISFVVTEEKFDVAMVNYEGGGS